MTQIVNENSAVLGLSGTREQTLGVDADHSEICKFAEVEISNRHNLPVPVHAIVEEIDSIARQRM